MRNLMEVAATMFLYYLVSSTYLAFMLQRFVLESIFHGTYTFDEFYGYALNHQAYAILIATAFTLISLMRDNNGRLKIPPFIRFDRPKLVYVIGAVFMAIGYALLVLPIFAYFLRVPGMRILNVQGVNPLLVILAICVAAPFTEELIFRGKALALFRYHEGIAFAVILQAMLFGIFHLNVPQGINAAVFGVFAGLAMIWTRTLWIPMIAHALYNGIMLAYGHYDIRLTLDGSLSYLMIIYVVVGSVTLYLSVVLMHRHRSRMPFPKLPPPPPEPPKVNIDDLLDA